LIVAIVGLLLIPTPAHDSARWIVGGYALLVAGWEAIGMIRQLLKGHAGLDILAVTAIVAAVLVGEPWAALVVVLMLTGGAALEDYAEHRSKRELTALLQKAPQQAIRFLDGAYEATEESTAPSPCRLNTSASGTCCW
jgi:cation transport ATPase